MCSPPRVPSQGLIDSGGRLPPRCPETAADWLARCCAQELDHADSARAHAYLEGLEAVASAQSLMQTAAVSVWRRLTFVG